MQEMQKFIHGFRSFQEDYFSEDRELFDRLKQGQRPRVVLIGCSDSRVDPSMMVRSEPGELFIVRNVANLVPPCEHDHSYHGVSAALEYAVCHLEVEHIIVLGHSCCGGIRSLMEGIPSEKNGEYISKWVSIAERAKQQVLETFAGAPPEQQAKACEHASILVSLENLLTFPWIRERVEADTLDLHGWYFDIESGNLYSYQPASGKFELLV
ncbi:MAG: carbonic anhydrase [Geobacter sp.]|jgi:carbonic anhydrase|nr:carbonic anhydrase [Geobacter sp.]